MAFNKFHLNYKFAYEFSEKKHYVSKFLNAKLLNGGITIDLHIKLTDRHQ